jgi:hypothetical protein
MLAMALVFAFVVVGCATTPLDSSLMNPAVAANEHAILYITKMVRGAFIDGNKVISAHGSGSLSGAREPIILLTPGKHSINAQYYSSYSSTSFGSSYDTTTTNTSQSGYMTVSYEFLPGHSYYLYPLTGDGKVSLRITDETDPTTTWNNDYHRVAAEKRLETEKKKVASAKPPTKFSKSYTYPGLFEDAQKSEPTKFEGLWVSEKDPDIQIFFAGKAYISVLKKPNLDKTYMEATVYIDKGVVVGLGSRKAQQKGIFDFTDNALTLTPLMQFIDERDIFVNEVVEATDKYEYSFGNDNGETLNVKSLGIFVKSKDED